MNITDDVIWLEDGAHYLTREVQNITSAFNIREYTMFSPIQQIVFYGVIGLMVLSFIGMFSFFVLDLKRDGKKDEAS